MGHMQEPVVMKSWKEPMPFKEWIRAWAGKMQNSDLLYKKAASTANSFFLYGLPRAFIHSKEEGDEFRAYEGDNPLVISEHRSKSVPLPVLKYRFPCHPVDVKIRDNFHDYKISVISETPVDIDPRGLWDPDSDYLLNPVYFEGFAEEWVFPKYGASDKKRFSLQVRSEHEAWTFMFLLRRALD